MNFFTELNRRNVFRVAFAYAVVAWVVAQVADLALESFGSPPWVMKTILFLMAIGWLIAIFIAWAYEITPDGIKREADVDRADSIGQQTGRKLDRLVIVVLVLAVAVLLLERFLPAQDQILSDNPEPTPATQLVTPAPELTAETTAEKTTDVSTGLSIAVLPFVNMSADPEQEYFSDGISEEILNVLSRIPNLKVAARTSSFQFKGKNLDIKTIAQQLKVNHVLEGSVRKAGNMLRITAQLIDTNSGFHLWSNTFDRPMEDVFAIQDEISLAIATELRTRLSARPENVSKPATMAIYQQYLKGRSMVAQRREYSLLKAVDILTEVVQTDPQYAPAMASLATAYLVLPWYSDAFSDLDAREKARKWSSRALEIEPDNAEALATLGLVKLHSDHDFAVAQGLLERAVEINPGNIEANNFLGDFLFRAGDVEAALKYELKAAELDPLAAVQLSDLCNVYLMLKDYTKAKETALRILQIDPEFSRGYVQLANALLFLDDQQGIEDIRTRLEDIAPVFQAAGMSYEFMRAALQGDRPAMQQALEAQVQQVASGEQLPAGPVAEAILLADFDTAGRLLMLGLKEGKTGWMNTNWARLPEQAPESEPWQEFWQQPAPAALAKIRRSNKLSPHLHTLSNLGIQQ